MSSPDGRGVRAVMAIDAVVHDTGQRLGSSISQPPASRSVSLSENTPTPSASAALPEDLRAAESLASLASGIQLPAGWGPAAASSQHQPFGSRDRLSTSPLSSPPQSPLTNRFTSPIRPPSFHEAFPLSTSPARRGSSSSLSSLHSSVFTDHLESPPIEPLTPQAQHTSLPASQAAYHAAVQQADFLESPPIEPLTPEPKPAGLPGQDAESAVPYSPKRPSIEPLTPLQSTNGLPKQPEEQPSSPRSPSSSVHDHMSPHRSQTTYATSVGSVEEKESINHEHQTASGNPVLLLKPTSAQWADFPAILAAAKRLGADDTGCFKVKIPGDLLEPLPSRRTKDVPANAYRVKQIKRNGFFQVTTVPAQVTLASADDGHDLEESPENALKRLKKIFMKHLNRQVRGIRYRVDIPAWTPEQRQKAGVPQTSPIHPLKGDKLDGTRAIVPGIHTPYIYESGPVFGALFQIHAEDFRLHSLNHLYYGRKIWIVFPAWAIETAEEAFGRKDKCAQFMRHRAEFFFPDRLDKLKIPYRIIDQRPGETIVILPDAYHEGFSTGYTIAEAKNYAEEGWDIDTYQPCTAACELPTAISADLMRPLEPGKKRDDLGEGYDLEEDEEQKVSKQDAPAVEQVPAGVEAVTGMKRPLEPSADAVQGREAKRFEVAPLMGQASSQA